VPKIHLKRSHSVLESPPKTPEARKQLRILTRKTYTSKQKAGIHNMLAHDANPPDIFHQFNGDTTRSAFHSSQPSKLGLGNASMLSPPPSAASPAQLPSPASTFLSSSPVEPQTGPQRAANARDKSPSISSFASSTAPLRLAGFRDLYSGTAGKEREEE
jgi:hypothetical protein